MNIAIEEARSREAEIIWDYMKLNQDIEHCDAILVLGSIDERVPEYAAKLFLEGYADWLIISGGSAHTDDMLATGWTDTEAEHFKKIVEKLGVLTEKIILEGNATNSGENITFTYDLLKKQGIKINSVLLVQKPYMERRAYATFEKQWPDEATKFYVTSPPIKYDSYFDELQPQEKIVNIMIGDLQRIKEYPALGFQTEQYIPPEVWSAYESLVANGYDKHLMKTAH